MGGGYLLPTLAAVFVGGTSVFGGRGSVWGTFIGAFMIGGITAGIIAVGLTDYYTNLVYGAVILISVSIHAVLQRRSPADGGRLKCGSSSRAGAARPVAGSSGISARPATTSSTSTPSTTARPTARRVLADLTDLGQCHEVVAGADAVVHLAAIPAPEIKPAGETFRNNALSTYNVFAAAADRGVGRVVWASSETVLGLPFDDPPAYAPTSTSATRPGRRRRTLSKLVGETMADQFARRTGDPVRRAPDLEHHGAAGLRPVRDVAGRRAAPEVEPCGATSTRGTWPRLVRARSRRTSTAPRSRSSRRRTPACAGPSADLMAEVYPDVELRRPISGRETLLAIDHAGSCWATPGVLVARSGGAIARRGSGRALDHRLHDVDQRLHRLGVVTGAAELRDERVEPDLAVAEHRLGDLLRRPGPDRHVALHPRRRRPVLRARQVEEDPLGLGLRRADRRLEPERPLDQPQSRPTAAQCSRRIASFRATVSGVPNTFQMSAYWATIRSVFFSPPPPIMIGRWSLDRAAA